MTIAFFFAIGLIALVVGAELLVRGAARLAALLGIAPIIIGLTVVAFGTSAPELAVSLRAAWSGQSALTLGNAVGSNIFNVLFILGVSALLGPLLVKRRLVRLDIPILIAISAAFWFMAADGRISLWDGGILVAAGVAYIAFLALAGGDDPESDLENNADELTGMGPSTVTPSVVLRDLLFIAGGLALLVLGSRWLVDAAVTTAELLGVSDLVIGLTVVAAGTSLPEVATSVVASLRGQRDIAVGNVVGSNIFNLLFVMGLAALAGNGLPVSAEALAGDVPFMMLTSLICLPIFFTGFAIVRSEGALLLLYYGAYVVFQLLRAGESPMLPLFNQVLLWVILPVTALLLAVGWIQARRRQAH